MKIKLIFLFFLIANCCFSQSIKILSLEDNLPIEGVVLMSASGEYLCKSDVNGEMDESLVKNKDFLLINHPLIDTDTLFVNKIIKGEFKVKAIKETKIPEVNIVTSTKDFIIVKGYFNSYVTNNSEFNIFVDGIIEYVFDRKTGEYKSQIINEYRSFILESKDVNRKEISSFVFDSLLKLPELNLVSSALGSKSDFTKKYDQQADKTIFAYHKSKYTEEEFKFLGYVFKDSRRDDIISFDSNNPKISRLISFGTSSGISLKHKSEEQFSKLMLIRNFYPTEMYFKNKKELEKGVKFNRWASFYQNTTFQNQTCDIQIIFIILYPNEDNFKNVFY